jgi:hypothetical protein
MIMRLTEKESMDYLKDKVLKLFILQKVKFDNDTHGRFSITHSKFSD